jgi:hypothetical protein
MSATNAQNFDDQQKAARLQHDFLCCRRAAFLYAENSRISAREHLSAWQTLMQVIISTCSSSLFSYILVSACRLVSVRRITLAIV